MIGKQCKPPFIFIKNTPKILDTKFSKQKFLEKPEKLYMKTNTVYT